jgi:IPT/TIG domain-containing protein
MQKCKQCEWEFPDDIHICPYCGHPVDPEDQKQKRRLNLRWHPRTLPRVVKGPGLAASRTTPNTLSRKHLPVVILISTIIAALLLTGILWAHAILIPPSHPDQPLIVNPSLLDFRQVKTGSKSVLSVIVKKSSESRLKWQIVPTNAQWLEIALRPKVSQSSNLMEDIYDVTANTGKLTVGKYSALLVISSESGSRQQVTVKIQVISNRTSLPAKLNVNPLLLDYRSLNVGNQDTQVLVISNSGGQELRWTVDKGNTSWLTLDQNSGKIAAGAIPQSINVRVNTTNLTTGQYSATIKFTSNGGNASADVKLIVVSTPTPENGPVVTRISPKSGPTAGGTSIIITGTGFTGATGVSFGSTAATSFTVNSSIQITAVSPAGKGNVGVTVTTPRGTSPINGNNQFTYNLLPTVTGISPKCESTAGSTGFTDVTITGTGFTGATSISFGSIAATSFTVDSDTQITVASPPASGTVDVIVTTPSGTSATSPADLFTYPSTPSVTSISPTSGPDAGGTSVTLTGTGFICTTSVSFDAGEAGTTIATSFTVDSDTQITAISPSVSRDGIVDVTVTTPGGTSATSSADQFTYFSLLR